MNKNSQKRNCREEEEEKIIAFFLMLGNFLLLLNSELHSGSIM